jgi:hypothetical protein
MNLISREELKEKLDHRDRFKLVNALGEWASEAKRIPGSININNIRKKNAAAGRRYCHILFQSIMHCKYNRISDSDTYGL